MYTRTLMMIGEENLAKLSKAKILICGVGGVGGMTAEALARSGAKYLRLVDHDVVSASNINRQLIATQKTIGQSKVGLWKERILEISPEIEVDARKAYFDKDSAEELLKDIDYIVDAIDSVKAKADLIFLAKEKNIPILSAMGMANKTDPTRIRVTDIAKTTYCGLARALRYELKKKKVKKHKVVFTDELPFCPYPNEKEKKGAGPAPASMMIVPATAGLLLANELMQEIFKTEKKEV